ncbi:MAG: copper homeostasis protein CutC [Bacteroidetes bacterium]|nr:copper homeostasis protein CutC [Bacteroidota bacterium]
MTTIEVCAGSLESAIIAQQCGAHRVELCDSLETGGLTPSFGTLQQAARLLRLNTHVLIRPRNGDYVYDDQLLEVMVSDIALVKQLGFKGVVIGALDRRANIDLARLHVLLQAAEGLSVTFHRAFDLCAKPFEAAEKLIQLKVDRILTSGQRPTAFEGIPMIADLVREFGQHISFMPGSGINGSNISEIIRKTGVNECHLSGRQAVRAAGPATGLMRWQSDAFIRYETSASALREIMELVKVLPEH